MVQYGVIESLFKVKKSGQPDCTDEGLTVYRAGFKMAAKAFQSHDAQDVQGAFLLLMDAAGRCNYWASVEGQVLATRLEDYIWSRDLGYEARDTLVALEQGATLGLRGIDFGLVGAQAIAGFLAHWDPYNFAKAVSITILLVYEMISQMYIES